MSKSLQRYANTFSNPGSKEYSMCILDLVLSNIIPLEFVYSAPRTMPAAEQSCLPGCIPPGTRQGGICHDTAEVAHMAWPYAAS